MKKFPVSLLGGVALILVTVILFFVFLADTDLEAIHFISLGAILLAEGVTLGYSATTKGDPRRVAAAGVSVIMIPVALVLSIIYMNEYPEEYGTYFGWYFAATILVNAICLVLYFQGAKSKADTSFQNAKANMLNLRKMVKCIMLEPAAKPYDARLRALEEDLHFSNDTVIVQEDARIRQLLAQLQTQITDPQCDVDGLLTQIGKAVQTRKIMTSRNA